MRIISMQSSKIDFNEEVILPDKNICNFEDNKPVYEMLFNDYNKKHNTNYDAFFWGFSETLEKDMYDQFNRACEMAGCDNNDIMLVLEVPDDIILETDFYNFVDEICAITGIDSSIESMWETIYDLQPNRERQVIFPYIKKEWIQSKYYSETE